MYHPKQTPDGKIPDLTAHYAVLREIGAYVPAADVSAPSSSADAKRMQKVIDDFRRKYPDAAKATKPAKPASEDSPVLTLAKKWREEFRQARAGQAARQAHGVAPFEANGADKLSRYTVPS